ncbi:ATP-dependent DNA helicase RRM3-like [Aphis craccivora]|uniref:ATP-dependent DNA helicase RRM3-like n=1 Tax=Aphis craccivora TaxID=307492 RepID=A0A6G0YNH0_APHCR|nr:ATP-dependent DNA helicase RRM3-like [Aphis craccivora]
MTINKSKGQSLIMAEIGLREECFSHGQCYVTCFRVSSVSSLVTYARATPGGTAINGMRLEVSTSFPDLSEKV